MPSLDAASDVHTSRLEFDSMRSLQLAMFSVAAHCGHENSSSSMCCCLQLKAGVLLYHEVPREARDVCRPPPPPPRPSSSPLSSNYLRVQEQIA